MSASDLVKAEFLAVIAEVVAPLDHPDMRAFAVTDVRVARGAAHVTYKDAPSGPGTSTKGLSAADRQLVIEAAALTMAHRAGRLAADESIDERWVERLKAQFPAWSSCNVTCEAGWADLLFALGIRLAAGHPGPTGTLTQMKQKFGMLRVYNTDADSQTRGLVEAFEIVSTAVCEICSAPGALRQQHPLRPPTHTACDRHARGSTYAKLQRTPRRGEVPSR